MFTLSTNNETLRNLEEQVQYLSDFHKENQALASWGIRVIGQVSDPSLLPSEGDFQYGDTYAVGTEAPFDFYIWTRASVVGQPDYWFPFGPISIVGPAGPVGATGAMGPAGPSTQWFTGTALPSLITIADLKENDMYLQTNIGAVYQYKNSVWSFVANIRGPQGIQGIQGIQGEQGPQGQQGPAGEKGDVGGFINIAGIVSNTNQLPTPASLDNLTIAYLVGESTPYSLYIQVGMDSDTATWNDAGPFNAATLVMVNGQAQNVWDADTKLDKENPTFASDNYGCYVYGVVTPNTTSHKPTTVDGMIPSTYLNAPKTIVQRDNTGRIRQAPMDENLSLSGTGYAFTDGDFNSLIKVFIELASGTLSGTLTQKEYNRLNLSPVLMITLDNELYHRVGSANGVLTYQHISGNIQKTITVNTDYSWALSVVDKSLYSHNIYITFTTDVGGNGNVLLNIISNKSDKYTTASILQYIVDNNLLTADIQASGRYILSSGEGGAVTSFYSIDGSTMTISTIFSDGLVSGNIDVTDVTDFIVKLI